MSDQKEQKMKHGSYIKTDANFNRMMDEILQEDREILIALGRCRNMPEKREMKHGSYFLTNEKFREIVDGILRDKKELLDALKASSD